MRRDGFRLSIGGLMGLVGLLAFGLVNLMRPSDLGASAFFSLTALLLVVAALRAVAIGRAFWAGFAICGWAHFLLAFWAKAPQPPMLLTGYLVTTIRLFANSGRESVSNYINLSLTAFETKDDFEVVGLSMASLLVAFMGGCAAARGRAAQDRLPSA
jgi:hypothetical protein